MFARTKPVFLTLIILFLLASCSSPQSQLSPTQVPPTETPTPTHTPKPTNTVAPTPTGAPESAVALESAEFELVPNGEAGEVHQYEGNTTQFYTFTGEDAAPYSSTALFTISVLEADSDGYVLEWQYQETDVGELGELLNQLPADKVAEFESMVDLYAGVRVEYDTLPDGRIFGLRNTEEIQEFYDGFVENLASVLGETAGDQEILDMVSGLFENMFTGEKIESSVLGVPLMLHSLYGGTFSTDTPIEVINSIANPYGTNPIETLHEYEVVKYDPNRDIAVIQGTVSWEPELLEQMMVEMVTEMLGPMDEEMEGIDFSELFGTLLEDMTMETTIQAEAELSSGWITLYETTTRTEIGTAIQEHTITIRRVEE